MYTARTIGERSVCSRDKVGAVIVSSTNRIIDTGYNGPPRGFVQRGGDCKNWCPRARATPTGWKITDKSPVNFSIESEANDKQFISWDRNHRREITPQLLEDLGMVPVTQLDPAYEDCPSIHAEANALLFSDRSAREGGTIYVSSTICYTCAKLVANSGLKRAVFPVLSDVYAHRNPQRSVDFLISCGIDVDEVLSVTA